MAEKLKLIKSVKGGKLYENDKGWPIIFLEHVRVSFPHFHEPYVGKDDSGNDKVGKYQGTFMIDKADKEKTALCVEVNKKLTPAKVELDPKEKYLRDGDKNRKHPEYAGYNTISAKCNKRPKLRDGNNENVDRADIEDTFRSGYFVDLLFSPYFQDGITVGKGYGERMNATLLAVKFNEEAEEFAGGGISDDDTDDVFGGSGGGFDDDDEI